MLATPAEGAGGSWRSPRFRPEHTPVQRGVPGGVTKRAKRGHATERTVDMYPQSEHAPITSGPVLHERGRSQAILTRSDESMYTYSSDCAAERPKDRWPGHHWRSCWAGRRSFLQIFQSADMQGILGNALPTGTVDTHSLDRVNMARYRQRLCNIGPSVSGACSRFVTDAHRASGDRLDFPGAAQ